MICNINYDIRNNYINFKANRRNIGNNTGTNVSNYIGKTKNICYNNVMNKRSWDSLKYEDLYKLLIFKANSLPSSISGFIYTAGMYINGSKKFDFIDKFYKESSEEFSERINIKKDGNLFKESYLPEIKFINQVKQKIEDVKNKNINEKLFKNILCDISKEYLKTPVHRKKIFIY